MHKRLLLGAVLMSLCAPVCVRQAKAETTCNHVPPLQWLACLDAKPNRCDTDDLTQEILAFMPVKDTAALIKTLYSVRDSLRCRPSED